MTYCQSKLKVVIGIMVGGMLAALLFHTWQGWVLGKGYPYNTFIVPTSPYTDLSDLILCLSLPCPYVDVFQIYSPFIYVLLNLPALLPQPFDLISVISFSLAGFSLLFIKAFEKVIVNPWLRVTASLLLLGISYPIMFCVDRGNTEIILSPIVATGLYFYSRSRYALGTAFLVFAACSKFYVLFFLIFLVRQRKWKLGCAAVSAYLVVNVLSMLSFSSPLSFVWNHYSLNMSMFQFY